MRRIALFSVVTLLLAMASVTVWAQTTHVVAPGENLYRISLRYGVSMSAIAQANSISNLNLIFAGQRLTIPTGGGTNPTPAPGTPVPTAQPPVSNFTEYTVQRGDTLARIAARFGTTWQTIAQANNISNPNLIFAGTKLRIPSGGAVVTPPPTGGTPPPVVTNPPTPITGFELGAHVFSFNYSDLMRQTGFTWIKKQISFDQNTKDLSQGRGFINEAKARGFKIMLGVVGNPAQLAANPTQYYQDFAAFVGELAASGADAIEVWNEPNIDRQWPRGLVSGAQYTQMLQASYQAIKAKNGATLVVSGAPAPTGGLGCNTNGCNDDAYIAQMAAAGARNFMDCVGIHYNAGTVAPSATSGAPVGSATHYSWYYPSMVSLYSRTFPNKPLCFTEIGYLSGQGYGPLPGGFSWANNVTVTNQAEWLAQAVQLARSSGIVRMFIVWNLDSTNYSDDPQAGYAIIRPDGTCPACNTIAAVLRS